MIDTIIELFDIILNRMKMGKIWVMCVLSSMQCTTDSSYITCHLGNSLDRYQFMQVSLKNE